MGFRDAVLSLCSALAPRPPVPFSRVVPSLEPEAPVDVWLWQRLGMEDPPQQVSHPTFISGKQLHASHELWFEGRFVFCGLCGSWANQRPCIFSVVALWLEGPHPLSPSSCRLNCKGW